MIHLICFFFYCINLKHIIDEHTCMDFDLTGYLVPKGWKVMTWFRSVHLDPTIYPNPKEFDPERFNVSCKDSIGTFEKNRLIYGSKFLTILLIDDDP